MKKQVAGVLVCLALVALAGSAIFSPSPALATAPTTSIHIVSYNPDSTVFFEKTVDVSYMESTLVVEGDGTTHYYTEGPTFDPNNIWDPNEICPGDSLKDKGALKGTNLKDLCDLVGGAAPGDTIEVRGSDGYGETFDYANVYSPDPRQGPMVICWWKDGQYTGTWSEGMMLAFFTTVARASDGKLIFGHQDMHDCLPEHDWHYYYEGSIQYPSTGGLYTKYISEISIHSSGTMGWSIGVTGYQNMTVSQSWFENAIACHHGGVTYNDTNGDSWAGFPLWYLCGLADDGNIHGPGAFNDAAATAGYDIKISGVSGNCTLTSATVARNNNIIVANTLNGTALPAEEYPLKLVGSGVGSSQEIGEIQTIELLDLPPIIGASAGTGGSISPSGEVVVSKGANQTLFTISLNADYHLSDVKVDGSSVGMVNSYTFTNITGYHTIEASFAANPRWDVNVDHVCNILDLVRVGLHWGETGSPGWIHEDILADGVVNMGDVVVISQYWGQTW